MAQKGPISKSEYVYRELRTLILSGKLAQGEKILPNKIAKALNVSTIPVREAIGRLSTEGLIEIELHKGARVTVFKSSRVEEVFSVRALLEGYAARTATNFIEEEELKKLKQMISEMDQCVLLDKSEQFSKINRAFHTFIYEHSPYNLLIKMINNLWDGNMYWPQLFAIYKPDWKRMCNEEHKGIIKAIENRSMDETESLVREHQFNAGKVILENVKLMDEKTKIHILEVLENTAGWV